MRLRRPVGHLILSILLLGLCSAAASAKPVSAPHLTVDLVAEDGAIAPGKKFDAGLKFNLEKGWHIYWINAGDAGDPPRVQWKLPAGFQAGAIEWPAPIRLPVSRLMDYGYEDQVLLMVPIQAPADLKPGTTAQLSATVRWVVCREVCLPGHGDVSLTLPVSDKARPSGDHDLFARTKQSLPQPAPRSWKESVVPHIEFSGRDTKEENFVLIVHTGKRVASAAFFPLEAEQIENAAPQQVSSTATGVQIKLKKSEQLLKPITRLKGVVVLDGKPYEIDAPVRQSKLKS